MSEKKFTQHVRPRVLMIDNYDSFTWNVYQFLNEAGGEVVVYRNDRITVDECFALKPSHVVISPGPGCPAETGVARDVIKAFAGKLPVFGVCMGEQCMYEVYGGVVEFAGEIVHGKVSPINHDGKGCFRNIPDRIQVTRYHSLSGRPTDVPKDLIVSASLDNGIIMAVRHKTYCMEGVQFHPESVLSEHGLEMFRNFLSYKSGLWSDSENVIAGLPVHSEDDLKKCIKELSLVQSGDKQVDPDLLSRSVAQIISGTAEESQIAAFLLLLKSKGESATDVHAIVRVLRQVATPCKVDDVVDIVGTGGDGHDTFNVSTASGIVVAGAGVRVAKHGNRSSSSKCGSADILEKLGADLGITATEAAQVVTDVGYCFLYAPTYHPALKEVAKVRRKIGIRTIFNIIGPLVNPADPKAAIVGVYHPSVGRLMADTLILGGLKRGMVVCGHENLDEISISGPTHVWDIKDGEISEFDIEPLKDFGVQCHPLSVVSGGDPDYNSQVLRDLFDDTPGPNTDFVLVNAAALLVVAGKCSSFKEGVKVAQESISSGSAKRVFDNYIKATQKN